MKIKKSIFSYILVTAFAVGSMSCTKLLDVAPQNKLVLNQFWLSNEQAVAFLAAIYATVGTTDCNITGGNLSSNAVSPVECYIYWGEIRGELMQSNPGKLPTAQVSKENIDNFLVTPNDVMTKYTAFYKIINEANQAIKNIPGIKLKDPGFTQLDEDQLTGEACFLRAFAYFWLVRTFKEVPLMLEPSETDNQNYDVPKSPSDTVFAQIAKDLERAKLTLPEWYDNRLYAHCRATKYTAMTVLSDVYLWMAALSNDGALKNTYYQKVIDNCDAIINSGRYLMLHGQDLPTVWSTSATSESIFETYSNSLLNNQVNNLYDWFNNRQYMIASPSLVTLFTQIPNRDYRAPSGYSISSGVYPPAVGAFTSDGNNGTVLKYSKSTKDAIWNFYRYPEVLLMKAEALSHLYKDDPVQLQNAADLVNMVRFRAYGVTDYPIAIASSTLEMDGIILDERGREFFGEGKRWFELVRFASRDNFANPDLLTERVASQYSIINQMIMIPRIVNPESWYLPFNADAIASNPSLVQNPYYQ